MRLDLWQKIIKEKSLMLLPVLSSNIQTFLKHIFTWYNFFSRLFMFLFPINCIHVRYLLFSKK